MILALSLACFVAVPMGALQFADNAYAQTNPSLPEGFSVSAEYGDSLSDYALPAGWSWDSASAKLSSTGSTSASATYKSSNPGYDKQYVSGYTVDVPITVSKREVRITWGPTAMAYTGKTISITASVSNAAFKSDKFSLQISGGSQTKAGSYKAVVTSVGNSNYTLPSDTSEITTTWSIKRLETGEVASVVGKKTGALPNSAGWLNENAMLKAPDGYQISSDGENWYNSISASTTQGSKANKYYLQESATESVTEQKSITVKTDTVAPTISSAKATPSTTSASIKVVASDKTSGIAKYTLTGGPSKAKISGSKGSFTVTGLKAKTSYKFTAKVTDAAGNTKTKTVKFVTKSSATSSSSASKTNTSSGTSSSASSSIFPSAVDDEEEEEVVDEEATDDSEDESVPWDDESSDEGEWLEEGEDDGEWVEGDEESVADIDVAEDPNKDISIIPVLIALGIVLASALLRWGYDAGRRKLSAAIAAEVAAQLGAGAAAGAGEGAGAAAAAGAAEGAAVGAGAATAGAATTGAVGATGAATAVGAGATGAVTAGAAGAGAGAATAGTAAGETVIISDAAMAGGVATAAMGAHSAGRFGSGSIGKHAAPVADPAASQPTMAMPSQRRVGFDLSGNAATSATAAGATMAMPKPASPAATVRMNPLNNDTSGIDVMPDASTFANPEQGSANGDLPGFMKR